MKAYAKMEPLIVVYSEASEASRGKRRLNETILCAYDKEPKAEQSPRLHYTLTSIATNAILLVEKPSPDSLLTTRDSKEALFGSVGMSDRELALPPQAKVISYQHAKDIKLWEEVFHQLKLTSACSPTLDKGLIVVAAIKRQMRFVGLYRNDAQKDLVDATCLEFLFKSSLEDESTPYFVSRAELLNRLGYEAETKGALGIKQPSPNVMRSLLANAAKNSGEKPEEVDDSEGVDEDMDEEDGEDEEEEEEEEPKEGNGDDDSGEFALENLFAPPPKKQKVAEHEATAQAKAKAKAEAKAKAKGEAKAEAKKQAVGAKEEAKQKGVEGKAEKKKTAAPAAKKERQRLIFDVP